MVHPLCLSHCSFHYCPTICIFLIARGCVLFVWLGDCADRGEEWSFGDECLGSFSTHTASFLLNDCDGLIFCTIFADDGDDKA